jgi:nitrogen regulatory protein P-II 1
LLSSTVTAVKSSPILDRKIDETGSGLPASYTRQLHSISKDNASIIVDYITAMKNEVNLADNYRTDILQKNGVGGITFYEIRGAGRMKREAVPEMVRTHMTGRTITPEYVKRTKVEVVVPDSAVKMIVDGLNDISPGKEAHGMIFVKDVSDAYEIGTKVGGEAALSVK